MYFVSFLLAHWKGERRYSSCCHGHKRNISLGKKNTEAPRGKRRGNFKQAAIGKGAIKAAMQKDVKWNVAAFTSTAAFALFSLCVYTYVLSYPSNPINGRISKLFGMLPFLSTRGSAALSFMILFPSEDIPFCRFVNPATHSSKRHVKWLQHTYNLY